MNRRGVTLVELAVVLMILLTLIGVVVDAATSSHNAKEMRSPPTSWNLHTAQHDGHWFVADAAGGVCHHPDCPCHSEKSQ